MQLAAGLHVITNTTLTRRNVDHALETVDFLHRLGLRTFAMNGMIFSGRGLQSGDAVEVDQLRHVLPVVRDRAKTLGMRFLWYTPTDYCRLSPVELELGPRRCNAGEYSMCIEPNGDVLPCQSYYVAAGNILRDPWPRIWDSDLFRGFRDRVRHPRECGLPEHCWQCPDLDFVRRRLPAGKDEGGIMNWEKFFHRFLARHGSPIARAGIEPGLYHYQRQADGVTARLHLRVDASGNGVLLANAACAVRLHPSGVVIAKGLLEGQDEYAILEKLTKAFSGVTGQQVAVDMNHVQSLITSLEKPHHDYPILNPADPSFSPHVTPLERPISADVPLCKPFYMEPILSRLWDEGIPHVTIIAGKDPVEKDLIRAVEKAEDLGLITGVRGRGSDLAHCARIPDMAQAGLDHLDVYCLSIDEQIHNGLVGKNDYKTGR